MKSIRITWVEKGTSNAAMLGYDETVDYNAGLSDAQNVKQAKDMAIDFAFQAGIDLERYEPDVEVIDGEQLGWNISVTIPEDSLGEIEPAYFGEMLEAVVDQWFAPASFAFRVGSVLHNTWSVDCPEEQRDSVVEQLNRYAEQAFSRCCREEAVPNV